MKRLLLIAPYLNRDATGEAWSTWKWVDGIVKRFETTLITTQYPHHAPLNKLFPVTQIRAMSGRVALQRYARWSHSAKPDYVRFYYFASRTIAALQATGTTWDIAHQLSPLALRYPSPLATAGIPYVLGPHAGSVINPSGFRRELRQAEPKYMRLRDSDRLRFRYDPFIRKTHLNCSAFIAVAPYVLSALPYEIPARTYFEFETGIRERVPGADTEVDTDGRRDDDTVRMLFVGRITRSKGCRDLVRALPSIRSALGSVHLDVIGDGPDRTSCQREAEQLEVGPFLEFHGHQPHANVLQHYRRAHLFVFPSFREPSGNVVFEAMQAKLPLIVANAGGPGDVVTDECGAKVDPIAPQQFSGAISKAVVALASHPETWDRCGDAARRRVAEIGTWEDKLNRLEQIYCDVLGNAVT